MTATAALVGLIIGYFMRDLRRAYLIWGVIWVLVLIVQTIVLYTTEEGVLDRWYAPVQLAFFAAGVLAVWLGSYARRRRGARAN